MKISVIQCRQCENSLCPLQLSAPSVLFKHNLKHRLVDVAFHKRDGGVVLAQNLPRDAQPDAAAVGFGGEERNENLFLIACRDGRAVVGDAQKNLVGVQRARLEADFCGTSL